MTTRELLTILGALILTPAIPLVIGLSVLVLALVVSPVIAGRVVWAVVGRIGQEKAEKF